MRYLPVEAQLLSILNIDELDNNLEIGFFTRDLRRWVPYIFIGPMIYNNP